MPSSPSTPSNLSSGVDEDFIVVDDSLRSFKLCETFSSSSHSGISFADTFSVFRVTSIALILHNHL